VWCRAESASETAASETGRMTTSGWRRGSLLLLVTPPGTRIARRQRLERVNETRRRWSTDEQRTSFLRPQQIRSAATRQPQLRPPSHRQCRSRRANSSENSGVLPQARMAPPPRSPHELQPLSPPSAAQQLIVPHLHRGQSSPSPPPRSKLAKPSRGPPSSSLHKDHCRFEQVRSLTPIDIAEGALPAETILTYIRRARLNLTDKGRHQLFQGSRPNPPAPISQPQASRDLS
jgi:hypothetical protein